MVLDLTEDKLRILEVFGQETLTIATKICHCLSIICVNHCWRPP